MFDDFDPPQNGFGGMDDDDDFDDDFEEDFEAMDDGDTAYWLEPDFILTDLVATLVNMSGVPLGVTLMVKGTLISGTLISEQEYLQQLTESFHVMARDALKDLAEADLEQIEAALNFRGFAEGAPLFGPENKPDIGALLASSAIRYLHLADVVVVSPQPSFAFTQGVLPVMRIKLNQVDGWMVGQASGVDGTDTDAEIDTDDGTVLH